MPLTRGSRLGHYEILSWLGAGGMGEVYRARDSRLNRVVAIKILRPEIAGNADSRRRFEREARAVSSLNHPHICALYDIGQENDVDFLVLEHLEGVTLSDRLKSEALPLEEGLRLAIEIMAALEGAHRCGVIHRDLKPGNIMLTKHGAKLLDFGLARLKPTIATAEDQTAPPLGTAAHTLTAEASIFGTLPYMSPEQIEGKEVDARSDIFSAGIIIFEMVTGRRAFEGSSPAAVMAAILKSEPPPMSTSRSGIPRGLDRLVRHCLTKNRDERFQSAHDVGLGLRLLQESLTLPEVADSRSTKSSRIARFGWIAATIGIAALAMALLLMRATRTTAPREVIRFSLELPTSLVLEEPYWSHPSISPDGRIVAFVASSDGKRSLWVRALDARSAMSLPGTEGASAPFWSPDSRVIAFFAEGKLKTVAAAGGTPRSICDVPSVASTGTWGSTGTIVFQIMEAPGHDGLYRVAETGGAPTRISLHDASGDELVDTGFPHFLPGGRFLFLGRTAKGKQSLYATSLDSEISERIPYEGPVASRVEYAPPGYLLGAGENTLYAQRFDVRTERFEGDPVAVAENVMEFGGGAPFSVSSNGVLVCGTLEGAPSRLTWFNRAGHTIGSVGAPAFHEAIALAPDERRLAVGVADERNRVAEIWIFNLPEGVPTRMTSGRMSLEFFPVWSPDGREIAYSSPNEAPPNLYRKRLGDHDPELLVPPNGHAQFACDWSPDGQSILYVDRDPKTWLDLWVLHLGGDRKPEPWLQSPFNEGDAQFSPDGEWVAYASDETGRNEVYVRPFRGTGEEKKRMSGGGGRAPRWRGDGKEIFYVDLGTEPGLNSVQVDPSTKKPVGPAQPLFRLGESVREYEATRDGQRFLVNHIDEASTSSQIHVMVNWTSGVQ